MVSSLQGSGTFINTLIGVLTVAGQQLFSRFTFACPCQAGKNLYYGSAFLAVPTLVLLIIGYALRTQTWRMITDPSCRCPVRQLQGPGSLHRQLACLVCISITGRALVAPLMWLAVTLLTGTYYECAASEWASVDRYPEFDGISPEERRDILAGFPCSGGIPAKMTLVREEVMLQLRYSSQMSGWILVTAASITAFLSYCLVRYCSPLSSRQHHYWDSLARNDQQLFEEAAEQHARFLVAQRVKNFFGFVPGSQTIQQIRIPTGRDWREIAGFSLVGMADHGHGPYCYLGDRDDDCEEGRAAGIELTP
ncbi:calcium homeostasis modulator protein 4 [Tachyglossus aculeatus]|uniref:calcium homeostasis modulator protein 4 n=1 Tax=Tachyglossus aculeatus TaxID=9261 RepID=UPI0018F4A947|nr:calcium homeostasis modulator protein 4 [Tachyglossus aculeatus]